MAFAGMAASIKPILPASVILEFDTGAGHRCSRGLQPVSPFVRLSACAALPRQENQQCCIFEFFRSLEAFSPIAHNDASMITFCRLRAPAVAVNVEMNRTVTVQRIKKQLHALTGLRFLAAVVVVGFHFFPESTGLARHFFQHGFIGVNLFFLLSGFILTYTYGDNPGRITGSRSDFWIARLARVYPVYLLALILFIPIVALWGKNPTGIRALSGLLSLFLLQAWGPFELNLAAIWNPPGWSLSVEAFFYLVFPASFGFMSNLKQRHLVFFGVAAWALSLTSVVHFLIVGVADKSMLFNPLLRLPEFILGIVACLIWQRRQTQVFDRLAPAMATLSFFALTVAMFAPINNAWYANGVLTPVMALLICSLACQNGMLSHALSHRSLVLLGASSYSLYILHWPLWMAFCYGIEKLRIVSVITPAVFFSYLMLSIAVAVFCFKCIEDPLSKKIRKRLSQHARDEAGAAPAPRSHARQGG